MAEQISASKPNVTVVHIDGSVFLRDATGKSVPLKEGQQLNENEIFVTSADGRVQLLMPNGELLEIGGDRTVQVDAQMLGSEPADAASAAIADLNGSTGKIVAAAPIDAAAAEALLEQEATAAGLGGGAGGEGHSFVELSRIAEGVNPLAFNFAVSDSGTLDLPLITALPVQPSPNPAILGADTVSGAEDSAITGNVLTNDSDADGPLTVTGFTVAGLADAFTASQTATIPNIGTLLIAPNGDFTFTPVANYNGPVPVITYSVIDPVGGTGSSTLTLTVTPVDDPANLQADSATILEDTPATGNVLSNDSDPDGALTVTGFTVAGLPDSFTAGQSASIPNVGTLIIAPNGDYTFTPVANYNGPVPVITYNVADPQGGTGSSTLTLTITPVDDPANLQADSATVLEDTPATGNVLSNDSDPDGPLTVTGFTVAGLPGTFTPGQAAVIPDVGSLVIAPNGDYTFTPVENYNGQVPVVTYNVVDPAGGTGSSTLTLTVTPVDDPVISQIEVGNPGVADDNVVEGNNLVFNVSLSTATTKAETYAFNLGGGSANAADYGTATFSNGVTYNPTTGLITVPAGVTNFAVTLPTVDDALVEITPETVPLTIGGVSATGGILDNDSPAITGIEVGNPGVADDNVVEGNNLVFNVSLSTATTKPETYAFNLGGGSASAADYGTATFSNGVTYNPTTGLITVPAGVTNFAVTLPTVDDALVEITPETVPLTIGGVSATGGILDNDSPAITGIEVGNPGVADDNVVEGNNLVFNVSLSTATTKPETYAFNLGGGSASAADYGTATFSNGVTYNATTGLITVPAGVTNFAVTLPTVDDALVEITPETVPLTIGGVSATGGILDNDSPDITGIEVGNPGVADDNVVEGNNLVFNVSLSTATTKAETYAFNLGGGSASAADYGTATFSNGVTYNATTGLITVPAGVTNFAVTLPTVDDALVEITPETVPLTIGGVSATGGILDNDSPAITGIEVGNPGVADDNVVEGNNLVFNVSLSTATTKPETYAFNLGGGSASAADYGTATFSNGVTYNATTGLITVPAGVTNFAVTLPTVDDALVEITPETVPLTIGGVSATGGILDNDSPAITGIEVGNPGVADDNVVEGNNLVFNVSLSTATTKAETYAFNLGGGSASAADYGTATFSNGVTYNPTTGLITVPAGVTNFAVTLPTVDDALVEITPETVPLTIGGVSATGGILDNDSPAITGIEVGNPGVADDNVVEGNNLVFNVSLSTATTKPETYAFNLGGGSANAADYGTATFSNGVTYNPTTGLITVPAGVTNFAVTLPTVDDALVEITPETVPLTIGGVSATGGILDNDSPAITGIEVGNPGVADDNVVEGNNLVFNVSLSTATTKPETYAFNLGGGSANAADYGTATFSNGVTYNPTTGLITVPAGVTNFAVTLPTVDDALVEITPETVPLTIGGVSATGGILDNDSPAITGIEVGNPGVADDNVVEGNNLVFNVSLSTATTKAETYAFNLGGGSASAADYGTATFSNGVTYNPTTGLITVPAGVTNFAVTLPTVDDALVEITPETVPLTIGGVSATGGILDNDSPAITGIEVGNPGVADDNVVEGNNLVFNVSLSTATTKPETYAFNLGGGSASAADYGTATFSNGVTYNATTGLITVPAGVTNFAVTLPTVDDALVEITPETVPLTIGGVSATGGILDNDSPAITGIEVGNPGVADDNVVEGNNLVFNVSLSTATTKPETYAFNLGGGSASVADYGTATFSNGVTYNATTGLITVPAGVTNFAVTLPTVDDALVEITPETVPLTIGGVSATGGILDNDSPAITGIEVGNPGVADDNVVEGNNLVFNVSLSTATTKPETYAFNLGGGSASAADYGTATFSNGVTYNATTGLITVPAGVTNFAVTLPTVDDALVEITPETVPLTIGGVSATGGILDNDSPAITGIEVGNPGVADDNVVEGNNLVFNVSLSTATTKPETYAFNLGGGSASAADYGTATFSNGVTYNATTGLITVPAGVTNFAVTLPTVDDALVEITPETVPLTIGGVSATGGILDNDSPAITGIEVGNPGVADDYVVEGNNLVFNVSLSTATTKPETYAFNLGGGSASAADYGTATFSNGVTYNATTGLITVPAGVTNFAVTLPTVDDALVEITPETVPLTIGGVSATGGILDNDSPAITGIEVGNPGVADDNVVEGNNLVFNVSLSTATTKAETYAFNLGGGSASAADYGTATFSNGVTYNATTGLITVPAGVTNFAVTLPTVDDALVEITPETVPLTIGGVSATGGILDNDSPAITGIEVGNPGVADDNVVEGNNLVFNVSLSTATTKAETYAFNLGGGSASAADYGTATFSNGVTYNATTGLITVPAGVTNFAVTLPTVDDALVEITPETVPLTIGGVSATGGILDNDSPAITGIEVGNPGVADDNVVEGNNLVFNVSLSTATTKPETYAFNLGGGSASAADYGTATFSNGVTYNATTGLITVPAGVTNFAVTLPTVDDALVEITPETVPLTIGGVSATGGILDNDSPAITGIEVGNPGVADDNVVEGNNLVFNVSLSTATTKPETYAFNLGGGSASAADYGTATFSNGVTYNPTTGLVTVPAGVANFAVTLPTVDDALVEITRETVPLTIGGVSATGGILDNDFAPDTNNVSASGIEDQALPIAITLSGTDADGTVAGFRILNLPGNGTLYRDAAMTQLVVAGSDLTAASNSLTLYFKPAHDWSGSTNFNYAAKDNTGLIDATPGTATINVAGVNDAPVIANASATVSEEGLAGGIIDNTGSPTDTTNSTVSSGTIAISDPDSTTLTTTLLAPTDVLSSGGQALVWSGSGTQDLVAKVGSTTIAAIHIDNAGHYTVTLSGPIDHPVNSVEDVKSFNVGVQVSDGSLSSTGTLTVNVEDDAPVGQSKTADVQIPNVDSNLILTIDVSGSMADPSGIPGKTRLQVAKEAITKLIDDYDVLGDVKVMLVTFSSSAATQQSGGQTWMSVDEAKTILANLSANGGTNYDAAVGQVMTHYDEAGKIAGGQNIAYFFSDGAPNPGLGLDAGETLTWTNFLNAKDINSLALGLGTGVTATNLNPLAYNGTGSGSEANAIIVTDLAQLPPILRDTIVVPDSGDLTGGVISGASSGFGADGGHMNDITVDGVKYTFDVAHNSVVTSAAAGTYTFDAITHQLKVNTALGGQFAIDMDDGKYTYTPPVIKTSGSSENIGFTLIDNDGDLDTSNSHLTINIVPPAQGNTMQLSASTTAIADSARGLHGEFFGYNNDPDKSAGTTYNVQNQDNTVGNLDNLSDITSVINGRQGSNIVGTQTEASAAASDATFIADAIKYGVTPAVTGNLGTNNAVTAGSAITSGNLYNFLGANNAGADTAGLAATSTFGNTTDSIMRMVGGAYFAAGTYDIRVYADDGFRIAVDGQSVFEYNANQPPTTRVQTGVAISEGMHNLEVLYWEQGGNAALKIEFKPSGSADSAYVTLGIDDMALFHGTQAPVLSELQDIIEDPGNNGHYLVRSGQEVTGTNLSDTITGSAGRDIIHGGAGNDVINAGAGADRLDGGAGSDTLTGGLGADTFHWALADKGAVGAPVIDKITDFSVASYNAGGDRLDLKDLLQGENHNVNTGNLTQYLHFEKSGTDTIVHVSSSGAYTGPFNSSADDQRVILSGVDLTSNGSLADAAIIQDLLNKGKLITD